MAKIYIDPSTFIDAICELAQSAIHREAMEKGWVISDGNDGTEYTEEGQDAFNSVYDEIEETINRLLKIYSNEDTKI